MTADTYQLQAIVNEAQLLTSENQTLHTTLDRYKHMNRRLYAALIAALAGTNQEFIDQVINDYKQENPNG